MKKLIFVFVALFVLVLISGCNARNNKTTRFNENTADITSEATEKVETDEVITEELTEKVEETKVLRKESSGKLEILSFDGALLKTNLNENIVRGGTSKDTASVTVNGYKLNKYIPGTTEWNYIASASLGNMKDGWNDYVVKTLDKNGKQISSIIFSIDYDEPATPEALPHVGTNAWLTLLMSLLISSAYFGLRKLRWL